MALQGRQSLEAVFRAKEGSQTEHRVRSEGSRVWQLGEADMHVWPFDWGIRPPEHELQLISKGEEELYTQPVQEEILEQAIHY